MFCWLTQTSYTSCHNIIKSIFLIIIANEQQFLLRSTREEEVNCVEIAHSGERWRICIFECDHDFITNSVWYPTWIQNCNNKKYGLINSNSSLIKNCFFFTSFLRILHETHFSCSSMTEEEDSKSTNCLWR